MSLGRSSARPATARRSLVLHAARLVGYAEGAGEVNVAHANVDSYVEG